MRLLALALVLLPALAQGAELRGRMVELPAGAPDALPPGASLADPPRRIVYMNFDGGTYHGSGVNNASTNESAIIFGDNVIAPWSGNALRRAEVMACVRNQFGRFNLEITDVDPGLTPHIESVVAGRPGDLNFDSMTGGVSPSTCGVIERSIVYTFAEAYGTNNTQRICETVAQEVSHSFGLDHEHYCPDPMTYLTGCGKKTFQDYDAPCGEDEDRDCKCGGVTQNSVQQLLLVAGPAESTPPVVTISSPADASHVFPGATVEVEASDDYWVESVELLVDGVSLGTRTMAPFTFTLPLNLAVGGKTLEARAVDPAHNQGSATAAITIDAECSDGGDECQDGKVCKLGACVRELGATCNTSEECESGLCARDGDNLLYCTLACSEGGNECPAGFACAATGVGGDQHCWASEGSGGCGCSTGGADRDQLPLWLGGLGGLGLLLVSGRRRARR